MATWYYYNEKGDKIAVSGGQLKGLAKAGLITPETLVETEEGKTAPARKVRGLTFAAPEPAQSVESAIYGMAVPPPKPSPFTAPMPETIRTSVADSAATENPFTAPKPVAANPFTVTLPATAMSANSPFTASMPIPANPFSTSEQAESSNTWMAFASIALGFLGSVLDLLD